MDSSSSPSKAKAMSSSFRVGQRCACYFYSSGRTEVYDGIIVELFGVVGARFQIDGGRIVRVSQSQLKAF
jgi:hypothetical protein